MSLINSNPALHFLWNEKYRPQTLEDCVLPSGVKKSLLEFRNNGDFPNLLLTSTQPGTGKTTSALALCRELGIEDILFINASKETGIDLLRSRLTEFCSAASWTDKPKVVILDECDNASPQLQAGLRGFIEEFSKNSRFIFTANYKNKLIEPLHSRLIELNYAIPVNERKTVQQEFFKRVVKILKDENITFEPTVVGKVIMAYFPDFRKCLGVLQRHASSGTIDVAVLGVSNEVNDLTELSGYMSSKMFSKMREYVAKNNDLPFETYQRYFYDKAIDLFKPSAVPELILLLADYGYKSAFVTDREINLVAMLTEIMRLDWA